jgi:hypothetical protein
MTDSVCVTEYLPDESQIRVTIVVKVGVGHFDDNICTYVLKGSHKKSE